MAWNQHPQGPWIASEPRGWKWWIYQNPRLEWPACKTINSLAGPRSIPPTQNISRLAPLMLLHFWHDMHTITARGLYFFINNLRLICKVDLVSLTLWGKFRTVAERWDHPLEWDSWGDDSQRQGPGSVAATPHNWIRSASLSLWLCGSGTKPPPAWAALPAPSPVCSSDGHWAVAASQRCLPGTSTVPWWISTSCLTLINAHQKKGVC